MNYVAVLKRKDGFQKELEVNELGPFICTITPLSRAYLQDSLSHPYVIYHDFPKFRLRHTESFAGKIIGFYEEE